MIVKAIKNTKILVKDLEYEIILIKKHTIGGKDYFYVKLKNIEKELSINNFKLLNGDKIPNETYLSPNYDKKEQDTRILFKDDLKNGVRYIGKNKKIPKDIIHIPEDVEYSNSFNKNRVEKIKIKYHNRYLSVYSNFEKVTPKFMKEVRANKMNSVLSNLNDGSSKKVLIEKKEKEKKR